MKVSIITPILNRQQFHPAMKRIVSYQTYPIHEHIILEEQFSYDNHKHPIPNAKYILFDKQVSVGHKLNMGNEAATGDLIVIMSSDDYFDKTYVERWINIFQNNKDIVMGGFSAGGFYNIIDYTYIMLNKVTGGHFVYRKEITNKCKYPDKTIGEDSDFPEIVKNIYGKNKIYLTDEFKNLYLAIRHCPAKIIKTTDLKGRVTKSRSKISNDDVIKGEHSWKGDLCNIEDPHRVFLKSFIKDPLLLNFYLKYRNEYYSNHSDKR